MAEFRPNPEPREPLDADTLADLLNRLQAGDLPDAAGDPRLSAARRLVDAPRPVLRAEASARIEAQLMAAAQHMPVGTRHATPRRRVSWPLAAAAALVLALAAVLVPELEPSAASLTPTPTATLTATSTITPSASPTLTLTVTPSLTLTLTATPTVTGTLSPTPDEVLPAEDAALQPEAPAAEPEYDCANPPPDNAQALGWREHCEDGPAPNAVAPGQGGGSPGNSGNAPGRGK